MNKKLESFKRQCESCGNDFYSSFSTQCMRCIRAVFSSLSQPQPIKLIGTDEELQMQCDE